MGGSTVYIVLCVLCVHVYYAIILSIRCIYMHVRRQGERNKLLAQVAKRAQLLVYQYIKIFSCLSVCLSVCA